MNKEKYMVVVNNGFLLNSNPPKFTTLKEVKQHLAYIRNLWSNDTDKIIVLTPVKRITKSLLAQYKTVQYCDVDFEGNEENPFPVYIIYSENGKWY